MAKGQGGKGDRKKEVKKPKQKVKKTGAQPISRLSQPAAESTASE